MPLTLVLGFVDVAAASDTIATPAAVDLRSVEVRVHGDAASVDALRLAIEGAVGTVARVSIIGVDTIDLPGALAPGRAEADVLASVWVELRPTRAGHATIVVVDGKRERVLVQHVAAPEGIDAAVREAVATICASAIEGLAAGAVIGIARAEATLEAEPPTSAAEPIEAAADQRDALPAPVVERIWSRPPDATPTSRPAPPRALALPLELGWAALAWARAPVIQHGPMLALSLLARTRLRPGGGVGAQYRMPSRVRNEDVRVRIDTGSIRAWGGVHPEIARRVRLRARLGVGVDLLRVNSTAVSAGVRTPGAAVHAIAIARASLGAEVGVAKGLAVAFDASLELDLVDTEFVLAGPARTAFDPWRPRPGLAIALAWDPLVP